VPYYSFLKITAGSFKDPLTAGIHAAPQASKIGTQVNTSILLGSMNTETKIALPQKIGTKTNDTVKAHSVPAIPISMALEMISKIKLDPPNPIVPNIPISTDLLATFENVKYEIHPMLKAAIIRTNSFAVND
jgi:hypothetical protein